MKNKKFKCCICGKTFAGYGNNPYPYIKDNKKECCDSCNVRFVIPARFKLSKKKS